MYNRHLPPTTHSIYDSHPELPLNPDVVQPGQYKWPPHFTPLLILYVFIGGCLGAYTRYAVSLYLPASDSGWPTATLVVNLLGSFLLGFLLEGLYRLGSDRGARRIIRLLVGTGFMGAFTTYSSFASDIFTLLQHQNVFMAITYGCITIVGGVCLGAIGIWIASSHHKHQGVRA